MNVLSKALAILFAITVGVAVVRSDDQPNIPLNSWEKHPEGIAVAMTFDDQSKDGVQKGHINVYMKNTSSFGAYYLGSEGFHQEVKIFIMRKSGEEIPMRDYSPRPGSKIQPPEIKPGETTSRRIDLSSEELAEIKGLPIKCSLRFMNVTENKTDKYFIVESSPRVLVPGQ